MNRVAKKRILIVLAVSGVIVAGTGGLYGWRKQRIAQQFAALRVQGMAEAKANDYPAAVRDLGQYIQRNNNDADALAEYCRVRPKVVAADRSHLRETMSALRYYVSLRPNALEQRRELLGLYLTYNLNTEALDLAERLLPGDAKNVDLLSAKAKALARLRRNDEALAAAQQAAILAPTDTEIQQIRIELLKLKGTEDAAILADVDALVAAHPDVQGLEIVRGQALMQANRIDDARASLKKAAAMSSASSTDVRTLSSLMNRVGLFDDSIALLVKLTESSDPADEVSRENYVSLARRLWERGDDDALLKLFARRPEMFDDQPDLTAIRGLTLRKMGKAAEGEAELAKLDAANATPLAKAWAAVVRNDAAPLTTASAKTQVDLVSDALVDRPNDAYLLYFLGDLYARTGDQELAISLWQRSTRAAPAWAMPLIRISNVLATQGRQNEAYDAAAAAVGRSQRLALQNYIQTWTGAIESGQRTDANECLTLIDQVLAQVHDQGWLHVARSTVLCRLGRLEEAKADVAKYAADASVKMDQQSMLRLAALSRLHKLGLDATIEGKLRADFGATADSAMTEFFRTVVSQGKDAALAAFEKARGAAPNPDDRSWLLADARLLDLARDPKADAAWKSVLQKFGDDVDVIGASLNSAAAWRDRAAVDKLIEKLQKLSTDRGLTWRLHRARWLIEGSTDATPDLAAAQSASDLLTPLLAQTPENVIARYWQAHAQVRLGNKGSAIENLLTASRLAPRSPLIALYAAQILQEQGDFVRAREQLERLSTDDMTDPTQNAFAAQLLAQQGRAQQAIEVLEQARNPGTTEQGDLLLALLYQRQGQIEKTEAIIGRLLQQPSLGTIAFAADFYRVRGKADVAEQTLQKLYNLPLEPGVREMTLADFHRRSGDLAQARKFAEAATVAAPQNVAAWRGLLLAELQAGANDVATQTLDRAVKALPADPTLAALHEATTWPLIVQVQGDLFKPLSLQLADDPKNDASRQALTLLQTAGGKVDNKFVDAFQKLAERTPLNLALQVVTAELLLGTGRPGDAAALASRGVQAFPTDGSLPRLAAQSLLSAQEWSRAKAFAALWRAQAGADTLAPDLLAAIASLKLGGPADAESLLRPYVTYAMDRLEQHADVIQTFAVALYATGKSNEAEQLVTQAISRRPAFAVAWLSAAASDVATKDFVPWLQRIEPQLNDMAGRTLATRVWLQLALRPDAPSDALSTVRQRVASLADASDLDANSLVTLAVICDQIDDDARAEQLYRRAMADDAKVPVVWNNLAMLLLNQKRSLDEAEKLAARAAALAPDIMVFNDTHAQVLLAEGKVKPARLAIDLAVGREPQIAMWRVTSAEVAAADGQVDVAQSTINDLLSVPSSRQSLGPDELRRAEALRSRLGQGTSTGTVN